MKKPTGWARDDAESLVELLVSVAILGVVIVAIIEVLFTLIGGSLAHSDDAKGQNLLGSWAESVESASYSPCATPAVVLAAAPVPVSLPTGYSATIQTVQYWNGSSFDSQCAAGTDTGLQLVTLSVTPPTGPMPVVPQTLAVAKRKPCGSAC